MRIAACLIAALIAAPAVAKLPPLSEDAKAKAAETAAKSAWSDKIGAYKTCLAMDRAAVNYRKNAAATGKIIVEPAPGLTACADPGPYVAAATPLANKPLEASGAHSPPGNATSPPSTKATAAEIAGGVKKPAPN